MKICFLCNMPVGGFKAFIENTVKVLVKKKYDVSVVSIGEQNIEINGVETNVISPSFEGKIIKYKFVLLKWFFKRLFLKVLSLIVPSKNNVLKSSIYGAQYNSAKKVLKCNDLINLSKFDCVISSEEIFCNYFLANNVKCNKKIAYIHPDYKMAHFDKRIDKFFLNKIDVLCAVSIANSNTLKRVFPHYTHKIYGIPNPLDIDTIIFKSSCSISEFFDYSKVNIITVCRLDNSSKALDRLLDIVLKLVNVNKNFVWRIVGDGPFRYNIESFIRENKLEEFIILEGFLENPIPLVKESDLFVLQSYYEGYPMSVCEALVVNTPALVTNFPASFELIDCAEKGYIVENNFNSIYSKILELINNKSELNNKKEMLKLVDKNSISNVKYICKMLEEL